MFHDIIRSSQSVLYTVSLPLPPPLNSVYRMGRGSYYKSTAAKDFTQLCGVLLARYKTIEKEQNIGISLKFSLKRDADIDSRLKVLLDSMQGFLYENDSQIIELVVSKEKTKGEPSVEVVLYDVSRRIL